MADTALLLDVGAGTIAERRYSAAAEQSPGPLRVALSTQAAAPARVDPQLRRAVEETGERLRALGHAVDVRDPDYGVAAGNGFIVRFLAGIAQDVAGVPRQDRLQRRTRGFGRLGRPIPAALVGAGQARRGGPRGARINRLFADVDVLVTPTTGKPPVGAAEWEGMSAARTLLGLADAYPTRDLEPHRAAVVLGAGAEPQQQGAAARRAARGSPGQRDHAAVPRGSARGRRGLDHAAAACPSQPHRPVAFSPVPRSAYTTRSPASSARSSPATPKVGIYACGPTVYDRVHIGNARPYVCSRCSALPRARGLDATLVVNVTDVNDKIYNAAREQGDSARVARRTPPPTSRTPIGSASGGPDSEPTASETIAAIVT